jgi:hypothetical protein
VFKYIFRVALSVFIFNFNCLLAFNKDICVEDLHIYNIFNNAKLVLMENMAFVCPAPANISSTSNTTESSAQGQNKEDDSNETVEQHSIEQKSLDLVEKEIELLRDIVSGFNKGLLFFAEYRFISICNFFSNLDSIEPKNIRAFERKITKFDNFIQNYNKKKMGLLDKSEVELCEKIMVFDQILLTCFLRYDFYNIDMVDRVIDTCVFRPVEFMGAHPLLTTSAVIIILSAVFYYYVYPHLNSFHGSGEDGPVEDNRPFVPVAEDVALDEQHPTLENKNGDIEVAQIRVFRQNGAMCGANAAFRLIAFHESHGDVVQAYKIANDAKRFNECCKHWAAITKVGSLNHLHSAHLDIIIKDYNGAHADNPIPEDDLTMVDDSEGLCNPGRSEFARAYGIDDTVVGDAVADGKRSKLENGRTQYFIINTAKNDIPGFGDPKDSDKDGPKNDVAKAKESAGQQAQPAAKSWFGKLLESIFGKTGAEKGGPKPPAKKRGTGWKDTTYGHWLSFMFVKDQGAKNGVRVIMADSLSNYNRTDDPLLIGLHRMLVRDL